MSFECKSICSRFEIKTAFKQRYAAGQRFCSVCEVFLVSENLRCLCCNTILRSKRHCELRLADLNINKNTTKYSMSERLVQIPIEKRLRSEIKKVKGVLTYSEFFEKTLEKNNLSND